MYDFFLKHTHKVCNFLPKHTHFFLVLACLHQPLAYGLQFTELAVTLVDDNHAGCAAAVLLSAHEHWAKVTQNTPCVTQCYFVYN